MENPKTLDDWLAAVTVTGPFSSARGPIVGWFLVEGPDGGALAWLPTYIDAYRFRLDYINRKLNPIEPTE